MGVVDGRQHAETLHDIRADHVERYLFAASMVKGHVSDLGCGIGYGSRIMAKAGVRVTAYELSADAIAFGKAHWNHPNITWVQRDLESEGPAPSDWITCFEVIEHLNAPKDLLRSIRTGRLIASVPNQDVMPFDRKRHSYHFRHYTKSEFQELLNSAGWSVTKWYGQRGKTSPVNTRFPDQSMTLVAVCERA